MDWEAFNKMIDAQIKAIAARKKQSQDRRQQQIPVAQDRRSGKDRRGVRRALAALVNAEGCGGSCNQGRSACDCRDK